MIRPFVPRRIDRTLKSLLVKRIMILHELVTTINLITCVLICEKSLFLRLCFVTEIFCSVSVQTKKIIR